MLFVIILICLVVGYASVNEIIRAYEKRRIRRDTRQALKEEDCRRILNVSWNAGQSEIDSAYQRLLAAYEPGNFTHLDDEFCRLAQARTDSLMQAYDALKAYRHAIDVENVTGK